MTDTDICINNWSEILLRKTHKFYLNAEFCDLTLEFPDKTQMRVHRLILNACTDFFRQIEEQYQQPDGAVASNVIILLPAEITLDSLGPIITFLYTGRLKISSKHFDKVYSTAKIMKMNTIMQILDHQKREVVNNNSSDTKSFSLTGRSTARKRKFFDHDNTYQSTKRVAGRSPSSSSSSTYGSNTGDRVKTLPPRPCRLELPESIVHNSVAFSDFPFSDIKCEDLIINKPNHTDCFDKAKESTVQNKKPNLNHNEIMKRIEKVNESLRENPYIEGDGVEGVVDSEANNNFNDDDNDEDDVSVINNEINITEIQEFTQELKVRNQQIINQSDDKDDSDSEKVEIKNEIDTKSTNTVNNNDDHDNTNDKKNTIKIIEDTELKDNLQETEINKSPKPEVVNDTVQNNETDVSTKTTSNDPKPVKKITQNGQIRKTTTTTTTSVAANNSSSNTSFPAQTSTAGYHCKECNLDINSYSSFRKHFKDIHTKSNCVFVCGICQYRSDRQIMHSYHQYVRHGIETRTDSNNSGEGGELAYNFPKCTICSFIAMTELQLDRHRLKHYSTQIQCLHCKTFLSSETNFSAHLQSTQHTSPMHKLYICTYCAKDFIDESNLLTHLKFIHKDDLLRDSLEYNDEVRIGDQQQIVTDSNLSQEVISNIITNVDFNGGNFVLDNNGVLTTGTVQTAYVVVDNSTNFVSS